MTEEKKKDSVLAVMFPGREVKVGDGVIKVTPLSLKEMPKVVDAFGIIMRLAEGGVGHAEIAVAAMRELLEILPFCIDRPPEDVPSPAVPDIIEIVLEQNLTETSVGKWTALIDRMGNLAPKPVDPKSQKEGVTAN